MKVKNTVAAADAPQVAAPEEGGWFWRVDIDGEIIYEFYSDYVKYVDYLEGVVEYEFYSGGDY